MVSNAVCQQIADTVKALRVVCGKAWRTIIRGCLFQRSSSAFLISSLSYAKQSASWPIWDHQETDVPRNLYGMNAWNWYVGILLRCPRQNSAAGSRCRWS